MHHSRNLLDESRLFASQCTSDVSALLSGKVDRYVDLYADSRACDVNASEETETQGNVLADAVLAAKHSLQLASAQIASIRIRAVNLASQR